MTVGCENCLKYENTILFSIGETLVYREQSSAIGPQFLSISILGEMNSETLFSIHVELLSHLPYWYFTVLHYAPPMIDYSIFINFPTLASWNLIYHLGTLFQFTGYKAVPFSRFFHNTDILSLTLSPSFLVVVKFVLLKRVN